MSNETHQQFAEEVWKAQEDCADAAEFKGKVKRLAEKWFPTSSEIHDRYGMRLGVGDSEKSI